MPIGHRVYALTKIQRNISKQE